MPIGYSKEPPLKAFVVAKIKKENAEKSIKLYKQKFNQYFYQYEYLKLIRPSKDPLYVELLFCLPEDLEKMREGFEVEEFFELQLPSIAPIHREQKPVYDSYWNTTHPSYEYPHKQYKDAALKMQLILNNQAKNKCLLVADQFQIEAEDESHINNARHCVMVAMEKLAQQNQQQENGVNFFQKQYYAKDLTLIIYQEPCIMCAMALIHSRIKEVYYYKKRASDGGLNSELQINNMKQLNHRYQVYYVKIN